MYVISLSILFLFPMLFLFLERFSHLSNTHTHRHSLNVNDKNVCHNTKTNLYHLANNRLVPLKRNREKTLTLTKWWAKENFSHTPITTINTNFKHSLFGYKWVVTFTCRFIIAFVSKLTNNTRMRWANWNVFRLNVRIYDEHIVLFVSLCLVLRMGYESFFRNIPEKSTRETKCGSEKTTKI